MMDLLEEKRDYTRQEIVSLLKITDKSALKDIYAFANSVRQKYVGDKIQLRGTIEFSNYCDKNCLYCVLRRSNEKIERYRLDFSHIINQAKNAVKMGFDSILLQSGEDTEYDIDSIVDLIKKIKVETDLNITLSIGERPEIEYKLMKEAGAERYILKHETSDPILYRQLHPDLKYSNRIKSLRALKQLGFETGSGVLIGLPGQTFESLANDILLFQTLDIDMIGVGAYMPHSNTPLAKRFEQAGGYFAPAIGYYDIEEMIYKVIAITRIVTKNTNIPATTALNRINAKNGRELAFKRGANMIMLNLTGNGFNKYYDIYPSKVSSGKSICSKEKIEIMLKKLGREIS